VKRYDVVTLFPAMFDALLDWGVTGRAHERGLYEFVAWNPRDFAANAYRTVDDRPYGGGPGMVMTGPPLAAAIRAARQRQRSSGVARSKVVYLSPQGPRLDHAGVIELAAEDGLVLLCGRYEGVDERLVQTEVDRELSLGDFVLSGGEFGAMALLDAVVRQLPGALGDAQSAVEESFVAGLLDHPHYTRPEVFEGRTVPPVLLSGHHADIAEWRLKQSLGRTWLRRPDLLEHRTLDARASRLLREFQDELTQQRLLEQGARSAA
jgi:tRNA (guanine37-N1)-methyltransferase